MFCLMVYIDFLKFRVFCDLRFFEQGCLMCVRKYYQKIIVNIMEVMYYVNIWFVFVFCIFGSDIIYKFKIYIFLKLRILFMYFCIKFDYLKF